MKETPSEYTMRMLGYLEGQDPLTVQARTPAKLERLLRAAPRARLGKRPAPQKWSVGEILAHLADAEIVIGWRIRQILGAPGTSLQAFDQDAWVAACHYDTREPARSVEQFRTLRQGNLALLKSLTAEQWKQHGMHTERGPETIEHIVRMTAGHDLNHTKQIMGILSSTAAGSGRRAASGR